MTFSGGDIFAFAFDLRDNGGAVGEKFEVFGASGSLGSTTIIPTGSFAFLGVISHGDPITKVVFDEDSGGDDIAVGGIHLATTTFAQVITTPSPSCISTSIGIPEFPGGPIPPGSGLSFNCLFEDQTVDEGVFVTLSALNFDGRDSLQLSWSQTGGPSPFVTLFGATSLTPTFQAPFVETNQTLTFQLALSGLLIFEPISGGGFIEPVSGGGFIDITVVPVNSPPIADAGNDGTVKEGAIATLDGSFSFDPDGEGDTISYSWSQVDPDGPAVTLNGANTVAPTFDAPLGGLGEELLFRLVVSDGMESSVPTTDIDEASASDADDTVKLTIVENSPPVADAGTDDTVDEGSPVALSGLGSTDPDGGDTISYSWSQTGPGPSVTLVDANTATPTFDAPPVSGLTPLTFELTVTDDDNPSGFNPKSDTDSVVINVRSINDPPSCGLAVADNARLWPPNHKMVPVGIDGVMDADSVFNMVTLTITGVTQDEPIDGTGDGDSSPDAMIVAGDPAESVMLRRERAGNANGRVYVVSFSATDGFEGCTGSVAVTVPHDRKGPDAVDDGQTVDSTLLP